MSSTTVRPVTGARNYLDAHELQEAVPGFKESWATERKASALLRDALELRSDFEFLNRIEHGLESWLTGEDLNPALSQSILPDLLATPGYSASFQIDGELHVRQAVIFRRAPEANLPLDLLVRIDVSIRNRHVPLGKTKPVSAKVTGENVQCSYIDLDDGTQVGDIMRGYLNLSNDFGPLGAARLFDRALVFLGDPRALGSVDAPEYWRRDLESLAQAFGLGARFHHGPNFAGTIGRDVVRVVRFEPYAGKPLRVDGEPVFEETGIDARSIPYDTIFHQIALALVNADDTQDLASPAPRKLEPGEEIFHRKIGTSFHFDTFDEGSRKPCVHKRSSFRRWRSSPKASKGFSRIYTNFDKTWLHHCGRYPNCGVYAVFCPV